MRDLIIPMFGSGMCEEECHMGTSLRREPKLLAAKLANSFLPAKIRKVIWQRALQNLVAPNHWHIGYKLNLVVFPDYFKQNRWKLFAVGK